MNSLRFTRPLVGAAATVLVATGLGVVAAPSASASTAPAALAFPLACTSSVKITTPTTYVTYIIPATPSGNTSCQLQRTNGGVGVKVLQQALNGCYGAGLAVDGDFGQLTEQALINAQRVSGASPVDGIYGPNTRDHLKWPSSAASNPCRIL